MYFIGGVFYIIFCDGNIQKWAHKEEEELVEDNNKEMEKYAYENNACDTTTSF